MRDPNPRHFRVRPRRPLYFMAKPDPERAQFIWSHPRADKRRPANLLHVTLLPLMDLALFPPETLDDLRAIMTGFRAAPFRVVFDRVEERRVVALRGSERILGAQAFQTKLVAFLRSNGFRHFREPPDLHLTLSYRKDGLGAVLVDPISWTVEELLLVESVFGETKHVVHHRWALQHDVRDAVTKAPPPLRLAS